MKIKGHHIAKLILTIVLSFTFSYCLLMMKTFEDEKPGSWEIEKIQLLEKDNGKYSNLITLKMVTFIDGVKESSKEKIIIYSSLFCILIVIVMDISVGVGRTSPLHKKSKYTII